MDKDKDGGDDHQPLKQWMRRTDTTDEALSAKVIAGGATGSPKYLQSVANELMSPGWHLCEVLEKITGIDARVLKTRPCKRSKMPRS